MLDWPKTTPNERLKWLRTEFYGPRGQTVFARALGISPSRYHNWEAAVCNVPNDFLRKTHVLTGCDAMWLMFGEGVPFGGHAAAERPADYASRPTIPVLAAASAAMPDHVAPDPNIQPLGRLPVPVGLHAVKVVGDSMVPLALDGQFVLCTDDVPADGDLAIVELREEDEVFFKRVYLHGRDIVSLVSINPDPRLRSRVLKRREIRRMRKVWGIRF
jgi:SOS-response transcriptional repressor LexA